jgi:hypothetical protein
LRDATEDHDHGDHEVDDAAVERTGLAEGGLRRLTDREEGDR